MVKVKVESLRCKQCELCAAQCPKGAISFTQDFNVFGYRTAQINDDDCIACGICYVMCPDGVYEVVGN